MILSLLRRKLAQAGIPMSVVRMVERLADVREIVTVYSAPKAAASRVRTILSKRDAEQTAMLETLDLLSYHPK